MVFHQFLSLYATEGTQAPQEQGPVLYMQQIHSVAQSEVWRQTAILPLSGRVASLWSELRSVLRCPYVFVRNRNTTSGHSASVSSGAKCKSFTLGPIAMGDL